MSKMYSVTGFDFIELGDKAKNNVRRWLNEDPIEYDDDDGIVQADFVGDWKDADIDEFCRDNQYVFDVTGKPIHNIIEG
jgi:hypothetical protein